MSLPTRSNQPDGDHSPVALSPRAYAIQRASPAALGDARPLYQDEAPVFVLANLRVAAGFPLRALHRHKKLAAAVFAALIVAVAATIAVTPKHYIVETKFFAEKNFVMPALGNPTRAVPSDGDSPTRLAQEAVMKRTNLMEIARKTKLLSYWDQMRSPLGKVRDRVTAMIRGPLSDSDKLEALLGVLEKRMWVNSAEGTVAIGIDWPDPAIAYRIVQEAQQNFFEQRHASEVSLIGESIGIIEGHVLSAQRAIQEAQTQINAFLPKRAPISIPRPMAVSNLSGPSQAVIELQADLRAKEQAILDISSSRSQRLVALQTSLAEMRTKFGPAHPDVMAMEENIRTLAQPSGQLAQLRLEETDLRSRLINLGAREGVQVQLTQQPSYDQQYAAAALASMAAIRADSQEAPEVTFARSRLKIATNDYERLLDRLEGAKIEMETARAAFKYRYVVITPARIPKAANKPKIPLMIIGGIILAAMTTIFVAIMLDFGGGRVIEPWQVDRQLGVPVLAEVRRR